MASSPGGHPVRKPICDEDAVPQYSYPYPSPLHSRTGALASLLRTRSQQSLDAVAGAGDEESRLGPLGGSHVRGDAVHDEIESLLRDETRLSQVLNGPMARSMKLIGRSKRYRWEDYWKSEAALACMNSRIRAYYERTNSLIQQYLYIDRLLDSSIPHDLLSEYGNELEASAFGSLAVPATIAEEASVPSSQSLSQTPSSSTARPLLPQKRMPSDIFRPSEHMPLLHADGPDRDDDDDDDAVSLSCAAVRPKAEGPRPHLPWLENADLESNDPIVTLAIWINLVANLILLAGKVAVIASVPSMSVLASLVDALLDLLSTFIVWTTTRLISAGQRDQYSYPIGRSRLEPLGVLVFSIIMVTSFCQVSLECIQRLASPEHAILQLGTPSLVILIGTIVIKGSCWLWTRLVRNSSVRALAEDAKTDVVFNLGSILFPIVGFYGSIWWLDAFGGLVLSLFVISVWCRTSAQHIRNLTGFSAQPDERNLLLYLTMRFATAIRQIQNLRAYHAGDKLVVEVDIVLSANTPLKDSHDLSEVLTYFLESVPIVDRAFVHVDYLSYNAPTHMLKQRDP